MLAKIAAVLAVLFAALTAPVIVSEIDATPQAGYPAPVISDAVPPPVVRECVQTIDAPGGVETCAAWAIWGNAPTLTATIELEGYPAP